MTKHNELAEVVGPVWSAARTADALGLAVADLEGACRRGDLLGLPTADGDCVFPVLQFQRRADGSVHMQPDVARLVQTLLGQPAWAIAVLLVTPAPELEDLSPVDWIGAGGRRDVLARFGEQIGREWR